MHHNKRRRAILRLFATLLKTGHEINLILCLCLGIEVAEAWSPLASIGLAVQEREDIRSRFRSPKNPPLNTCDDHHQLLQPPVNFTRE
jgi:hypothetical protein